MSTRAQRASHAHAISDSPETFVAVWADMPRRQAAVAMQSAAALLRGSQELMRIHMQHSMQYWSEFATAAFQLQSDMISRASEAAAEGASEPTLESLQRVFEATFNGAGTAATPH